MVYHLKYIYIYSAVINYNIIIFSHSPHTKSQILDPASEVYLMQLPVMVWRHGCTAPKFTAELPLSCRLYLAALQ